MKLFTTFALLSTALLAHAVSIPADLAFPLESRDTCSSLARMDVAMVESVATVPALS
ncbi:hypothetical protein VE00_05550 [Pseudogymnoascus sp. WSF 3629]|nr:hypothetical protein VE00_05550 [Pseudogymnoascus sp. WSF 3629]